MKKIFGLILTILIIATLYLALRTNLLLTFGSTEYYVKTTSIYKTDGMGEFVRYEYTEKGYDKKGNEQELEFTTDKILKTDKYLKIYYKNDKVKSYEEVPVSDLPEKAKEKLNIK